MKYACFVRHAESHYENAQYKNNEERKAAPLSERGKEQAAKFATIYIDKPSLIITSEYGRSKETSSYLTKKFPGVLIEEWSDIGEFNYIADHSSKEELDKVKKEYWNKCDPFYQSSESTESFSLFLDRAKKVLERIAESEYEHTVLFSHAKFMRLLITILTHSEYTDPAQAMKDLRIYSFRFSYCDKLELLVDNERNLYIKELRGAS